MIDSPISEKTDVVTKYKFSSYEKLIIALLAFLQFTIILDFMILSPLGAILMPALKISAAEFGAVVSGYAISAAIAGFLAAGFADRFDRKRLLIFFYTGFLIGTLLCGLAPTYEFLLMARIVTGLFGGVIGSIVYAITTDLFPLEQRGRVMGYLQTAFAASQILGLPAGLYLSNHWGWHMPFIMIVVIGLIAGFVIIFKMKPVREHLSLQEKKKAHKHILEIIKVSSYLFAFAATGLLSLGGFMLMPFGSTFVVNNLKISATELPFIYFVTGIVSIIAGPVVGRLSDAYGKYKIFVIGSILSITMVLIYTHLGKTPLYVLILINSLMFIAIFSRMIPSQALISAIPNPANRGAFMSVSSSLQSLAGGIGSIVAGMIVTQASTGELLHFEKVGFVICGISALCMWMVYKISRQVEKKIK